MKQSSVVICLVCVLLATPALAQSVELALGVGGYIPVNNTLSAGNAFAIQGTFSYRIFHVPLVGLYFDLPVVGTLDSRIPSSSQLASPGTYSAIFVAPGLKLKLAPGFPVSPFFAVGGGLARYNKSTQLTPAGESNTTSTNVFDVGGGLDMKIAPYFSVRGEVRDFYSGNARLRLSNLDERQHNIVVTGGLVFRW